MSDQSLEIQAVPTGHNGMVMLTAILNGEAIDVDKLDLAKADKRDAYAKRLVGILPGVEQQAIDRQLVKLAGENVARQIEAKSKPTTGVGKKSSAELLADMPEEVREAARQMLEDENLLQRIAADVSALGVAGEKELVVAAYLCGTSRLLPKPLALIAQGPSSSGKSYCVATVAKCFPPEAVVVATQMTPQALFYAEPGSLSHKFVVVGERSRVENDDTAEATRALREMISEGKLSKLVTMKIDGEMKAKMIEQDGPIAYVESTTLMKLFNEDANRCIIFTTDERPDQTRRIIRNVAAAYSGATVVDKEQIIARHHALQRMIESRPVVIPFAARLAEAFSCSRLEARRAFPHLLNMVQASALLHQRQRKIDDDGRIIASIDDYSIARRLLSKPFSRQLGGGVSDGASRLHDRLKTWIAVGCTFTTKEAVAHEAAENSDRSVRGWLQELADAGGLELVDPHKGPKPATWRMLEADFADDGSILPLPESIDANSGFRLSD